MLVLVDVWRTVNCFDCGKIQINTPLQSVAIRVSENSNEERVNDCENIRLCTYEWTCLCPTCACIRANISIWTCMCVYMYEWISVNVCMLKSTFVNVKSLCVYIHASQAFGNTGESVNDEATRGQPSPSPLHALHRVVSSSTKRSPFSSNPKVMGQRVMKLSYRDPRRQQLWRPAPLPPRWLTGLHARPCVARLTVDCAAQ